MTKFTMDIANYLEETKTVIITEDALKSLKERACVKNTAHWKAKSFHEVFCDNCGFSFDIMKNDFMDKMNYCPNCGAKMERKDTE